MKIEPIAESDAECVIEVIKESFLESVAPSWSDDATAIFLEKDISLGTLSNLVSNGYISLKATKDGTVLGVLLFSSDSKLAHLFVKPSVYKQGVAKLLFRSALNHVKDDVVYISLTSTEYAVSAYERLGFKKASSAFKYNDCIFQPMVYWLGQHRLTGRVEFVS